MGTVARFRRPSVDDDAPLREEDSTPEWSPRARTLTIVGAALASWIVVFAVIYLVA
ncbi:MAG: hypothetical protein WDN69_00715 [Aliidongia sp.]